jgi:hypothetical protein
MNSDIVNSSRNVSGNAINLLGLTIWTGDLGLVIYEEIHQNYYNRLLHVAFLPFVFYGVFLGFPPLVYPESFKTYSPLLIALFQLAFFSFYYFTNVTLAFETVVQMVPMALLAVYRHYQPQFKSSDHIKLAVILLTFSLVLQEIIGHSLFEEENSRLTVSYVLNAVLYSPVFYTQNKLPPLNQLITSGPLHALVLYTLFTKEQIISFLKTVSNIKYSRMICVQESLNKKGPIPDCIPSHY